MASAATQTRSLQQYWPLPSSSAALTGALSHGPCIKNLVSCVNSVMGYTHVVCYAVTVALLLLLLLLPLLLLLLPLLSRRACFAVDAGICQPLPPSYGCFARRIRCLPTPFRTCPGSDMQSAVWSGSWPDSICMDLAQEQPCPHEPT